MQSAYLCVIIHVKQLPFLGVLTWFLILGKIQDGDHCWWRHRPPAALPFIKYTSSCQKTLGRGSGGSRGGARGARPRSYFSIKMRPEGPKKIFLDTGPPSLSQGSGWPPLPFPSTLLLYHGGGYDFACMSEDQVDQNCAASLCPSTAFWNLKYFLRGVCS